LKQRLYFPVEENLKSMDSMAILEEEKIVETTARFCISKNIETLARLAIMPEQKKILKQRLDFPFQETTVRFYI